MKHLILLLFAVLPSTLLGQFQGNAFDLIYFVNQPSARSDAMGKGYGSIDGDLTSIFFNPAGTATINSFAFETAIAPLYHSNEGLKYNHLAAGCKVKDYLFLGLSRNSVKLYYIDNYVFTYSSNSSLGDYDPGLLYYSLNISSQPIKDLLIGINANYFIYKWEPSEDLTTLYFDLGVIKKFRLSQTKDRERSVNIGASIINLNGANIVTENESFKYKNELPVISRISGNYQFKVNKHLWIDTLKTYEFLFHGEYTKASNSSYLRGIHLGGEFAFLELFSVRLGWYNQKFDFTRQYSDEKYKIKEFTYGLGIQVPLHKLTKIPLKINFDYSSKSENIENLSFSMNWVFKKRNSFL